MSLSESEENEVNPTFEEVSALKELIAVIVDYYCFKNDRINDLDEDDDEDKVWKKHLENSEDAPKNIIPNEINYLIEESFKNQLKKFNS